MNRLFKSSSPLAIMILLLLLAAPAFALKGINPDGSLDKPTISKAYFEGEFWTVISALESFRKSGLKCSREDSVYTFKYLSVVYAADPTTRKKGESYMYQLIKMMPTIDLIDLYISDNIESIFKKVKSDFDKLEKVQANGQSPAEAKAAPDTAKPNAAPPAVAKADATAQNQYPAPPPTPAKESGKKKSGIKPWVPLAIGGVGVVAATYFILTLNPGSGSSQTPRPVDVTVITPKEGS